MSIPTIKFCLQDFNVLCFNLKVKKRLLLIMTFFFFCSFLSVGQTFTGSTGAIDDDNCPTTNDFTTSVSGVGVLGTTNFFNEVVINITHTYTGDLEMTLVAPGGAPSVLLSSGNGGSGDNYTDTHFRLDAILPIAGGTPPFTGDFRSEESLALFDGINADGNWILEICDEFGADVGTLDSWEITFGTEPVEPFICTNPINPPPSCNNFNVVVVLDESGSIDDATEAQVEVASFALANALLDTGAEMAFVEFAESGDIPTYGGFSGWNVVDQAYIDGLNNSNTGLVAQYGDNTNTSGPFTNWEDALNKVLELNVVKVADIVLFMTDGNPTAFINDLDGTIDSSGGTSTALGNALDESCEVKQMGSHIFMLGVGTGIEANNLAELSGPILDDGPTNPTLTVLSADYGLIAAGDLTQCFLDIAQSGCDSSLSLKKSVYAGHDNGASCDGEQTIPNPSDSKVTYCFTVSNDGDLVINNLDFSDSDIGIDENDLIPTFQTSIASGQSITYYYEMTFSGGQTFPFLNTAEITGETPTGDPLSDSSSAEVTESLCVFPSLTTNDISICSESKSTIDLSTLVTSNGTVSYHNSQLDADNNDNALTNINVDPPFDTIYYVRSQVAIDCYVTDIITISVTQVPEPPILECWQTAIINEQTCDWEITGEQPVEPTTACYETATFNNELCDWEITGEQPLEPEIECYEIATFISEKCQWEISGEQPLEPETACYETATFNDKTCQWEITGEQPLEPETACYETATFNDKTCQWEITGEQPLEPETECYEIATFISEKCQWEISGEQPLEPEILCYETATFNNQICQWEVTGEQPLEPETECYEIATFISEKCQWEISGEQPSEPETACYETATFNNQTCEWEISGEQPLEPEILCYETATFNNQICQWEVTGEQPLEPEITCYETATFNFQKCQWIVTGEQPLEPETACYETAAFNNQTCQWEVTGEQPLEPEITCYETTMFDYQLCEWIVTGDQPIKPETACYETATFNYQLCEWEVSGEKPLEPETTCYETTMFDYQLCEWIVIGEQPIEPETVCYETATFNYQLCEWEVTGEMPIEPATACYETATFNYQLCQWEISGIEPIISSHTALCDADFGTYSVIVTVSIGDVTSSLGNPQDNMDGTWVIRDIPLNSDVTITTSLGENCLNSIEIESPDCVFCVDLEVSYTNVTCFGTDDATITVDFVTEGAFVTVNDEPYNPDMLYMPGLYIVTATLEDSDTSCMVSEILTITEPDIVDVQVSSVDATCYGANDGRIIIESLSEGAFYTIKLNGIGSDLSSQDFFAPGTYVVEAKLIEQALSRNSSMGEPSERSQNPCVDARLVVIEEPEALICKVHKSYEGNQIDCNDRINNSLTVDVSGGTGSYTYLWSMDVSSNYQLWEIESGNQSQTMTFIPGIGSAIFTVQVTDENDCSTTCQIILDSTCTENNNFNRENGFDFEMHPNPTNGKLTIKFNKLTDNNVVVELYDLVGTKLINQVFSKIRGNRINIDLSDLPSQIYYLKVITNDGIKIKKVILDK